MSHPAIEDSGRLKAILEQDHRPDRIDDIDSLTADVIKERNGSRMVMLANEIDQHVRSRLDSIRREQHELEKLRELEAELRERVANMFGPKKD